MNDLITHMVKPLLSQPEMLNIVMSNEEEALIRVDIFVAEEDIDALRGSEGKTERALRHLLSIASGSKKPYLSLKVAGTEDESDQAQESTEESEEESKEQSEEQSEESSSSNE